MLIYQLVRIKYRLDSSVYVHECLCLCVTVLSGSTLYPLFVHFYCHSTTFQSLQTSATSVYGVEMEYMFNGIP